MRTYREIFFAYNGPGPWKCDFCEGEVMSEDLDIHHRDHDHVNNDPENLGPSHRICHASHHSSGRKFPQHSARMRSRWREGRYSARPGPSQAQREKLSKSKAGIPNPDHSERMKKAWAEGKFANRKPRSRKKEEG